MKDIIIIVALIAVVVFAYLHIAQKYHFTCSNCGYSFKASAGRLASTVHVFDKHRLTCPNCGNKEFMKQRRG